MISEPESSDDVVTGDLGMTPFHKREDDYRRCCKEQREDLSYSCQLTNSSRKSGWWAFEAEGVCLLIAKEMELLIKYNTWEYRNAELTRDVGHNSSNYSGHNKLDGESWWPGKWGLDGWS